MPLGGEKSSVQNPFLRYAQDAGWIYLSPDDV
jgi:type I restriction enzyme R subunit